MCSVAALSSPQYKVGDTISMKLMVRGKVCRSNATLGSSVHLFEFLREVLKFLLVLTGMVKSMLC